MTGRRTLLIYPVQDDFEPSRGILNKMRYQADAFEHLGYDVTTVVGRRTGVVVDGQTLIPYRFTGGRPLRVLNHYGVFWRHVETGVDARAYDVVYIRHPGANPAFLWYLASVRRRNPTLRIVLEVATYPFAGEADTLAQKLIVGSDLALGPLLRRYVDRVVTFGPQDSIYAIPCIRSSNGVDVDALPLRRSRDFDPRAPRFLGVASLAKWHGYDRVIRGLREALDGDPEWRPRLSLAGEGPASAELQALTAELGLGDYVTFHGVTTGPALDALFDQNDIGIASLGMHRIGLEKASSLKTREYCARGVPFVFAGVDDSFGENFPYAIRVPTGDAPVSLPSITSSYARLLEGSDPSTEMRAYAASNLSWISRIENVMQAVGA